jgi:hypothetical protein
MRMLSFCCLIPLAAFAAPAMSAVSGPTETDAPSPSRVRVESIASC